MHDDDIEDIYLDNDDDAPKHHGHQKDLHHAVETREEYKKFAYAMLGMLFVSSLLTTVRGWELRRFIADFMALGFIAGAGFKIVNIEGFVEAYRRYDLIGSRLRPWAYLIPYIGAFMGFWYLLSSGPDRLNVVAMLLTAVGFVGARQAAHEKHNHPSLGGVFRIPLVKISVFENGVLLVLATALLIL